MSTHRAFNFFRRTFSLHQRICRWPCLSFFHFYSSFLFFILEIVLQICLIRALIQSSINLLLLIILPALHSFLHLWRKPINHSMHKSLTLSQSQMNKHISDVCLAISLDVHIFIWIAENIDNNRRNWIQAKIIQGPECGLIPRFLDS